MGLRRGRRCRNQYGRESNVFMHMHAVTSGRRAHHERGVRDVDADFDDDGRDEEALGAGAERVQDERLIARGHSPRQHSRVARENAAWVTLHHTRECLQRVCARVRYPELMRCVTGIGFSGMPRPDIVCLFFGVITEPSARPRGAREWSPGCAPPCIRRYRVINCTLVHGR